MRMALKDEQTGKNKHFINSLEFAWQGIKTVFREERNMRKHVAFGVTAIVFGFLFSLTLAEWLWLLLAVFLVWLAEIINTIFENVVCLRIFTFIQSEKKLKTWPQELFY